MLHHSIARRAALALAATVAVTTAAQAGGFSRGSANLDGLFASEYVNEPIISSLGVTYVNPGRSYDSVRVRNPGFNPLDPRTGAEFLPGTRGFEFGDDFAVPFASVGLQFGDRAQCVASYAQPYGGDSTNQGPARFFQFEQEIDTYELASTCSVGFDAGRGRAYAIGGLFYEDLSFVQTRDFNSVPQVGAALGARGIASTDLESTDVGYRLGAAYEIPEIALKASVIYRSETDHDVEGTFENVPFQGIFGSQALAAQAQAQALGVQAQQAAAAGNLALAQQLGQQAQVVGQVAQERGALAAIAGTRQSAGAFGSAELPQQLELNVQSGVAPGTLVFGSLKWTDWSVIQRIDVFDTISNQPFTDFEGFFRDGYTATLGVGRVFTEELAGSLSLTYDRGVGTGFNIFSDTYTVAGGVAYDLNEIATVRAGGAVFYFTEDEITNPDADFIATAGDEFGYALSTSLNIKF